jgi:hypothetical protein
LTIRPRNVQAPLEAADIDIVVRHFRQQCDQHITASVLGGRQVGAGGFHRPADAPAQIQFPRGVKAALEEVVLRRNALRRGRKVFTEAVPCVGTRHGDGREVICRGHPAQGTRLAYTRRRHPQVKVGAYRPLDQGIEHRILERVPPLEDCNDPGAQAWLVGMGPLLWHSQVRPLIGRADCPTQYSGEEQHEQAGTRLTHGCLPLCAWDTRGGRALSASNPAGSVASMKMSICWPTYKDPLGSVKR